MASFQKIKANNKQGYKWVCIMDGPPDPVTGKRRQITRRGDTKKEAEKRAKTAVEKLKDSGGVKKKRILFDELSNDWMEVYSRSGVKRGTIRVRQKEIKIIKRYINKLPIDQYTRRKHQKMLNHLFDTGYASSTIDGVHTTTGMICKHAVKEGYIKENPCKGATVPKKQLTVEEIENDPIKEKYYEEHELHDFLQKTLERGMYMDKERFYLLAFSGLRPGELTVLKWTDFDFEKNTVRVTKTYYNETNNMRKYTLEPPKSKSSIRKVSIDEHIMEMMKKYRLQQKKKQLATKHLFEDYHDEDYVFCRDNGYPYTLKDLGDRMKRILKHTKSNKHATPHTLRHTHISMLAAAGVELVQIMKRVGHDDMQTTLEIYTHVTEKMSDSIDEKITNTFEGLLKMQEM